MKKLIQFVILSFMITAANLTIAAKNNFQYQISGYHTQRQGGQTLDVYVRYAMKDEVDYSKYPDYRSLRQITLKYLEPTDSLPVNTFWEVLAAQMGDELLERYQLAGVSVQMLVHPNEDGSIFEPGFHGPIYTSGDVIPFTQAVIPDHSPAGK